MLACAFFASQTDRFLTGRNLSLVVQQSMVVGVLAIGQTLIILTAGIDLSCGAVMALGSIVMTKLAVDNGVDPLPGDRCSGIAVCAAFGLLNGPLVTRVQLPPFIVTLGTLNIAFALTHIYSAESDGHELPGRDDLLRQHLPGWATPTITYGSVLMFVALSGHLVRAAPDRGRAPRLRRRQQPRGRAAERHQHAALLLGVYTVAGLFYGIAALLLVGRTGVGDPNAGQTDNLDSITAVVLGGTSLFGGRGSIIGTLVGALIVGVFRNGLQLIGVDSVYQILITGILVILAVAVDQFAREGSNERRITLQTDPRQFSRPAAWSSATATSPPWTAPISSSIPARFSRSSATTAPANPP